MDFSILAALLPQQSCGSPVVQPAQQAGKDAKFHRELHLENANVLRVKQLVQTLMSVF
jgi:hypothetical protein